MDPEQDDYSQQYNMSEQEILSVKTKYGWVGDRDRDRKKSNPAPQTPPTKNQTVTPFIPLKKLSPVKDHIYQSREPSRQNSPMKPTTTITAPVSSRYIPRENFSNTVNENFKSYDHRIQHQIENDFEMQRRSDL